MCRDISGISTNEVTEMALLLIDTAGCDLHELDLPEEVSKANEGQWNTGKIIIV